MRDDAAYRPLFRDAFPGEQDPVTLTNVVHVISTFVRTLVSFESPYDRFFRGDEAALGDEARRGLDLFRSNEFKCARLQIRPISARCARSRAGLRIAQARVSPLRKP